MPISNPLTELPSIDLLVESSTSNCFSNTEGTVACTNGSTCVLATDQSPNAYQFVVPTERSGTYWGGPSFISFGSDNYVVGGSQKALRVNLGASFDPRVTGFTYHWFGRLTTDIAPTQADFTSATSNSRRIMTPGTTGLAVFAGVNMTGVPAIVTSDKQDHLLSFVQTGTTSAYYVDGVLVGTANVGIDSVSAYWLGASNVSTGSFGSDWCLHAAYRASHDATQVADFWDWLKTRYPSRTTGAGVLFIGNSLGTVTFSVRSPASDICLGVAQSIAPRVYNYSIGGRTTTQMQSDVAGIITSLLSRLSAPKVAAIWEGTNDVVTNSANAVTAYNNLVTLAQSVKAAGATKVVMGTMLPRASLTNAAREAIRLTLNTSIRANTADWDAIADAGGDPVIGAYGADSTTFFYADTTHPHGTGQLRANQYFTTAVAAALTIPAKVDVRSGTTFGFGGAMQTGTLAVPSAANVLSGVAVDATTGTFDESARNTDPGASNVRLASNYKIANVSKTGTLAVPAAGSVALGVPVDQTTGTAVLTPSAVRTELATELARIDANVSTRATPAQILSNTANTLLTNTAGYVTTTGGSVTIDAQDIRDAMTLATTANAASGSIDNKLDGIKAKTDLISSGGDVTTVRRTSGYIEIVQSTANLNATGTEFTFTKASTDTGWPSDLLSNGSYAVSLALIPTNGGSVTTVSGGVVVSATSVRVDVSAATAAALTAATSAGPNYKYQVWASTSTTNVYCLDSGNCRVIDDIRS
jgi:hypothetical protein